MAIRQDGTNTQHLAGPATSSPASGDVTLLQWHMLNQDHNALKILFQYHNNGGDGILVATETDGTTADFGTIVGNVGSVNNLGVQAIAVGTWYYYGITRSGNVFTLYVGTESSGMAQVSQLTDGSIAAQGNVWRWTATGNSVSGLSPDGSVAQFRLYNRLLTPSQMDVERLSATPVSTTNLWTSNPFATAGSYGADAGSNQWTFTEQGNSNFSTVGGPSPVLNSTALRTLPNRWLRDEIQHPRVPVGGGTF